MVHHVDKHTSALKRLQIKDPFIELLSPEDRLAAEVEEIWQSTLDQFKMGTYTVNSIEMWKCICNQFHLNRFTATKDTTFNGN